MAREIKVLFLGDASDLDRASRQAASSLDSIGKHAGVTAGLVAGATSAAISGMVDLAHRAVGFIESSVKAADELQSSLAVTTQLIQQTGASSFTSTQQISKFAESLSNLTGVNRITIQQGANVLLTFRNVQNQAGKGNDIFNRATKVALDLSKVLGQDLSKSNIQLGKALADPVRGLTALRRVGVIFTDSQKEQIKNFVAQNDLLDAQKIILGEVEHEFGGAAEAGATASQKLSAAWLNFKEDVGQQILPAVNLLADFITKTLLPAVEGSLQPIHDFIAGVVSTAGNVGSRLIKAIEDGFAGKHITVPPGLSQPLQDVGEVLGTFAKDVADLTKALADYGTRGQPALESIGKFASEHAQGLTIAAVALTTFVGAFIALSKVSALIATVTGSLSALTTVIEAAAGGSLVAIASVAVIVVAAIVAIGVALYLAYQRFQGFRDFVNNTWEAIKKGAQSVADFFVHVWDSIKGPAADAFGAVKDALTTAFNAIAPVVTKVVAVITDIVTNIGPALQTVAGAVTTAFDAVSSGVSTAFGVVSSVVGTVIDFLQGRWAQWGDEITGIVVGIKDILVGLFNDLKAVAIPLFNFLSTATKEIFHLLAPIVDGFIKFVQLMSQLVFPVLTLLGQIIGTTLNYVIGIVKAFVQFMLPIWTALWNTVVSIIQNILGPISNIIEGILRVFQGFIDIIAGIVTGDWSRIWEGVQEVFSGVWEFITGQIGVIVGIFEGVWSNLGDLIKAPFEGGWAAIQTVVTTVWGAISGIFSAVIGFFSDTWSTLLGLVENPFLTAWNVISTTFSDVLGTVVGWFQPVINWFTDTWKTIETLLKDPFDKAWTAIKAIFSTDSITSVANVIIGAFKAAWNAFAGIWNSTVGKISISIPDFVPLVGGKGFDVPDLPTLGLGGIVQNPMLAIIGDRPEAVIPLDQLARFVAPAPGSANVINMRQTINAGFGTDRFAVERAVRRANHHINRLAGVRA